MDAYPEDAAFQQQQQMASQQLNIDAWKQQSNDQAVIQEVVRQMFPEIMAEVRSLLGLSDDDYVAYKQNRQVVALSMGLNPNGSTQALPTPQSGVPQPVSYLQIPSESV